MGNSNTNTSENNYMEQIKSINIDELDLSKIDALQLKVLKEMIEKLEKVEKRKSLIKLCISYLLLIYVHIH